MADKAPLVRDHQRPPLGPRGVFLQDLSWSLAWPMLWPMMVIAAVTLSYATWLFARKLQ